MGSIVIIDDHPIVREGLKTFLGLSNQLEVVGEASTADEGLTVVKNTQPELVLLDLQLPDDSGLKLIPKLRSLNPNVKIVVLTSFLDEESVREAMQLGATGFLVKHSGPTALRDGIIAALRGEISLDSEAIKFLVAPQKNPLEDLTPREKEVLMQVAQGLSNKAIANELGISEKTVKTHMTSILSKLNLKDRLQVALYARENNILTL